VPLVATANWKSGSTKAMLSTGLPVSRGAFRAKLNVMEESAAVTGLAMWSAVCINLGDSIALEDMIVAAAAPGVPAKAAAAVRVLN